MPYLLISTAIRLENGPTIIGDEKLDQSITKYLGAELVQTAGNPFKEWSVPDPPRIVLNKLECLGYRVVGTTGIGQTAIWTLYNSSS